MAFCCQLWYLLNVLRSFVGFSPNLFVLACQVSLFFLLLTGDAQLSFLIFEICLLCKHSSSSVKTSPSSSFVTISFFFEFAFSSHSSLFSQYTKSDTDLFSRKCISWFGANICVTWFLYRFSSFCMIFVYSICSADWLRLLLSHQRLKYGPMLTVLEFKSLFAVMPSRRFSSVLISSLVRFGKAF